MKIKKMIDDKQNYITVLVVWLVINSIRFVSLSIVSQIVSVFLGVWGIYILLNMIISRGDNFFHIPGVGISSLFVLGVALSFIGNGFISPIKNVYTIIAVIINFYILYTIPFSANKNFILKLIKIIILLTLILNLVNLFLLLIRYTYIIGDTTKIREVTFISFDWLRGRFTGLSGNANGLSRLALCGVMSYGIIHIYLDSTTSLNKVWRFLTVSSLVVNLLVILLSQSRASIYAISVGITLAFCVGLFIKHSNFSRRIVIVFASFSILFVSIKSLSMLSDVTISKYPSVNLANVIDSQTEDNNNNNNNQGNDREVQVKEETETPVNKEETNSLINDLEIRDDEATSNDFSNGRITLISNGVKATFKLNPIFGLTYSHATPRIQGFMEKEGIKVHDHLYGNVGQMHNTIFQSFVYYGFVGLIPLLLFAYFIIHVFIKSIISGNFTDKNKRKQIILFSFLLGVLFTMNMVEWVFVFDFDNHLINFFFMFTLGSFIQFIQRYNVKFTDIGFDVKLRKNLSESVNKITKRRN